MLKKYKVRVISTTRDGIKNKRVFRISVENETTAIILAVFQYLCEKTEKEEIERVIVWEKKE